MNDNEFWGDNGVTSQVGGGSSKIKITSEHLHIAGPHETGK